MEQYIRSNDDGTDTWAFARNPAQVSVTLPMRLTEEGKKFFADIAPPAVIESPAEITLGHAKYFGMCASERQEDGTYKHAIKITSHQEIDK